MNRIILAVFFSFLLVTHVHSQTLSIEGSITDSATGKPLAGVSVFFSNTSYGTVSNSAGAFRINNVQPGKYDLIISSVGYETQSRSLSLSNAIAGLKISMKQKPAELQEVVVRKYLKDGWAKWGQFFLENFIGTSLQAQQCKIKNTKVLRFSHSKTDNTLTVEAMEPLEIENKSLGYTIQYQLEAFTYDFEDKFLFYAGYALFTEMEGSSRKQRNWNEARAEVYELSQMRFMRSLFQNRLTEDGYQLYGLERIPNIEQKRLRALEKLYYQTVSSKAVIINYENTLHPDSTAYFKKIIAQKDPIEIIHPGLLKGDDIAYAADSVTAVLDFKNYLIVRYPKKTIPEEYARTLREGSTKQPVSSVIYLGKNQPIFVTANGYYYNLDNLVTEGFWGWWEKLSTLLPYDYKP